MVNGYPHQFHPVDILITVCSDLKYKRTMFSIKPSSTDHETFRKRLKAVMMQLI